MRSGGPRGRTDDHGPSTPPSKPIPVVLVLTEPLGGAPVDALCSTLADLFDAHRRHVGAV